MPKNTEDILQERNLDFNMIRIKFYEEYLNEGKTDTVTLPVEFQKKLQDTPESGMGYHNVIILMKDGTRHEKMIILNSEKLVIADLEIEPNEIEDVLIEESKKVKTFSDFESKSKFIEKLRDALYDTKHISTPINGWNFIDSVQDWPDITYEEEGETVVEPLDTENFEIIEIKDDQLVFIAGGDWQDPHAVTVKLVKDKLTAVRCEPHKWENGLNIVTALKALGAYDDYKHRKKEVDDRKARIDD